MDANAIGPGKKAPEIVNVIIENARGSNNKYEMDKDSGLIKLDRVLYSSVFFPADYGFIPQTLCEDGDPLDVFILVTNPNFPGIWVEARPIGMIRMLDQGEQDDKILAVPSKDPRFAHIKDISDVPPHTLKEIAQFLKTYKILENKQVDVREWENASSAIQMVSDSIAMYKEKNG